MSGVYEVGDAKLELQNIRNCLDGNSPSDRKTAAKRCLALMRSGENVQSLFSSMLRCVKTDDIELKKLAYLYLVNYSTQEPEQAIMAVNTFVNDSQDPSPLVRALAVRTMCRIRLENVAEHMIQPLKRALADKDPYVRKTAVFGVAKLYDFVPEAVETAGLFTELLKCLTDDNPMVVSNTTATIFEINERRTTPIFELNADTIGPLLSALTSCTEWCQTILFDALARYKPESQDDAKFLIDRLIPFLKHSNPSVVIGAFKCIFIFMDTYKRDPSELFSQIIPPFITLVGSAESEIQYVVLRTISLFVQKYPKALSKEIRVFFCKYNDPSYVKMEKLNIIVTICGPQTAQLVLDELSEYCNSVDVAFVQKAVRAIGQIAIKIEASARRCVDILIGLVKGKADYALEESIVVITDLLRKFPGVFESVIGTVCQSLEHVKAPRAKAAGIWILGEYASLIDNVDVILDPYLDTFHDEEPLVQLQILATLVKVFIEKPDATKDQLQFVLTEATKDGNVPDVKNRALVYWRLLSSQASLARDVVFFSKVTVMHSGQQYTDSVLDELMKNMGTVSGVLHVVPSDFVRRVRFVPEEDEENDNMEARAWHPLRVQGASGLVDLYADYDRQTMYLRVVNKSPSDLTGLQFAVDSNALGLTVTAQPVFPASVELGSADVSIPIAFDPGAAVAGKTELRVALNTSLGAVYGIDSLPAHLATTDAGNLGGDGFRALFAAQGSTAGFALEGANIASDEELLARKVFVVGHNGTKTYACLALPGGPCVIELSQEAQGLLGQMKGPSAEVLSLIKASAAALFA